MKPHSLLLLILGVVLFQTKNVKAEIVAFVDRSGLGENFVTMLECKSVVNFGISATIVTSNGEKFQIPARFVRGQVELPKPADSKANIENVIAQLKGLSGKYPQADRAIESLVARLEQQAMNAVVTPAPVAPVGQGAEITDLTGKIYKNVTVRKVDPDGLLIAHSGGVKKLAFTELSEEFQAKYGYDPAKAERFAKEQAALQAAARQQAMEQSRIREEEAKKAREMAALLQSAVRIHFQITQVLDHGLIIWNLRDAKTEFLRVNPDRFDVADGERYNALVISNGTYEYESIVGVRKRVREWTFVPEK
jgi:hypothetical protein